LGTGGNFYEVGKTGRSFNGKRVNVKEYGDCGAIWEKIQGKWEYESGPKSGKTGV